MTPDPVELRDLASAVAGAAAALVRERRTGGVTVADTKSSSVDVVTDADRASERLLRRLLLEARPDDSILGEEGDDHVGTSDVRWVVDPIDGTKNFVRGVPVWATLIALMDGDAVVAGLVSAPALSRRWWAGAGSGAYTGKSLSSASRMQVSKVDQVADASLSYSSLGGWDEDGRAEGFLGLAREVWRTRAYGDFWSYMLVAEGAVDVAAEPQVALHDLAAPSIVVTEAGGRFTDLEGTAGPAGGSAVATNGLLHDDVLVRLAP